MNRYIKSFAFVFVLYSALYASYIYTAPSPTRNNTQPKKSNQNVHFTIIQEKKTTVVTPKKVVKKKERIVPKKKQVNKIIPKKVKPKTTHKKKILKHKIKPVITKTKKIIQKPNIITKKVESTPKTKKNTQQNKHITHKQIKKNTSSRQTKIIDEKKRKNNKLLQQKYYTQIKNLINQNKSYPRIAIKRGIEGVVKITFTISTHGELLSFQIVKGKKVFYKSIEQAVKKSFPTIPPKGILEKNTQLSLTIAYKLY